MRKNKIDQVVLINEIDVFLPFFDSDNRYQGVLPVLRLQRYWIFSCDYPVPTLFTTASANLVCTPARASSRASSTRRNLRFLLKTLTFLRQVSATSHNAISASTFATMRCCSASGGRRIIVFIASTIPNLGIFIPYVFEFTYARKSGIFRAYIKYFGSISRYGRMGTISVVQ